MKKVYIIIRGVILILIGILLLLKQANILNINIFFKGFWTLFIIIPTFNYLIYDNNKRNNLIILILSISLLIYELNIIKNNYIFIIMSILILITILFSYFYKREYKKNINNKFKELIFDKLSYKIFNINKIKTKNIFIFCSYQLIDLSKMNINENSVRIIGILSKVDLILPIKSNVIIKSNPFIGGVLDFTDHFNRNIYVNSINIIGEVKIIN